MKICFSIIVIISSYSVQVAGRVSRIKRAGYGTCGTSDGPLGIIQGDPVQDPRRWPWQARLTLCDNSGCSVCGGSVINRYEIATASHCVDFGKIPANKIKVRLGAHVMNKTNAGERTYTVAYYTHGPDFRNDIAVLTLKDPIKFTDKISPVCLPSTTLNAGTICYVTGFGAFQRNSDKQSNVLRQAPMTILSNEECINSADWDANTELCVSSSNPEKKQASSCSGDSGGPLVCKVNGRWELHGIVSYGSEVCGDLPSVYVRVSKFKNWFSQTN